MSTLTRVSKLKVKVEELKAKYERACGAAETIRATLKTTWKCDSLADARSLLVEKRKAAATLESDFNEAFEDFQEKWRDELESV